MLSDKFNLCIIIPTYNHYKNLDKILSEISSLQGECIIIDDGSSIEVKDKLLQLNQKFPNVTIITQLKNSGKGAAVKRGFSEAINQGFSHVVQIDADGQHDLSDLPKFIKLAKENPESLILGLPVFSNDAPAARKYGRKISNFWVCIETGSFQSKDALCGYRCYPLSKVKEVLENEDISNDMGFDTDILVKMIWYGCDAINIPTHINYSNEESSHFKAVDNFILTKLHTKLCIEKIAHFFKTNSETKEWHSVKEKGSSLGIWLTKKILQVFGRSACLPIMHLIAFYFYVTARKERKASENYFKVLSHTQKYSTYCHFYSFALSIFDTYCIFFGKGNQYNITVEGKSFFKELAEKKQGAVILSAHIGNLFVAQKGLEKDFPTIKINSLMYKQNAAKINSFLNDIEHFKDRIFAVEEISSEVLFALKEKVQQGEIVGMLADRIVPGNDRAATVSFLGKQIQIPEGAFVLSSLLEVPVFLVFSMTEKDKEYTVYIEPFSNKIELGKSKEERKDRLQEYSSKFARSLESICQKYPYQWFNFYDILK